MDEQLRHAVIKNFFGWSLERHPTTKIYQMLWTNGKGKWSMGCPIQRTDLELALAVIEKMQGKSLDCAVVGASDKTITMGDVDNKFGAHFWKSQGEANLETFITAPTFPEAVFKAAIAAVKGAE